MNRNKWTSLTVAGVMAASLAACSNDKVAPSLINDTEVKAELATSAGDAMAITVAAMVGNEASALGEPPSSAESNDLGGSLTFSRSHVCYDASNAVVAGCSPLSSVRTIVTHVQLDGSRSGSSEDGLKTWSGAVHRTSDDSLTRVFVSTDETQRIHNDHATASDSVTATAPEKSFFFASAAIDSVKAVTFNLPHASNPWPASGMLVRRASVKAIVTKGAETESKDYTFRIQVAFPADAQGNVQLMINTTTCNLNLVTHAVTACVTP